MTEMSLKNRFSRARDSVSAAVAHPIGKQVLLWLKRALFVGVLYILWTQISAIGWEEVLINLPANPLFYLFWAARYFLTPAFETRTYAIIWKRPMVRHFWVFMRKRIYNSAVAGYSGEAFLTLWANRNLDLTTKQVLISVKDANILSAFSSNMATLVLLVAALATGLTDPVVNELAYGRWMLVGFMMLTGSLAFAVLVFRRKILSLNWPDTRAIVLLHGSRQFLLVAFAILMYAAAVPGVPLHLWLSFVVLYMVLTRIPFLPNHDLVYLSAALAISASVGVSESVIAGVLVCEVALTQTTNLGLFLGTSWLGRSKPDESESAS